MPTEQKARAHLHERTLYRRSAEHTTDYTEIRRHVCLLKRGQARMSCASAGGVRANKAMDGRHVGVGVGTMCRLECDCACQGCGCDKGRGRGGRESRVWAILRSADVSTW